MYVCLVCKSSMSFCTLLYIQKQYNKSIPVNELVTCGNITDPRIQFEVDVASKLTLTFKSDDKNEFKGVILYVMEFDPSVRVV